MKPLLRRLSACAVLFAANPLALLRILAGAPVRGCTPQDTDELRRLLGIGTHRQLLEDCPQYLEIASSQLSEEELALGGDVA